MAGMNVMNVASVAHRGLKESSLFVRPFGVSEGVEKGGVLMSGEISFGKYVIPEVNVVYDVEKEGWWVHSQHCKSTSPTALCCLAESEDMFIGLHVSDHHVMEPKVGFCI